MVPQILGFTVARMIPEEARHDLARRAALQLTDSLAWGSTASSDRRARIADEMPIMQRGELEHYLGAFRRARLD